MTLEKSNRQYLFESLEENFLLSAQIKDFRKDWYGFYKKISKLKTPQVDGTGKKIIDQKGKFDYIIVSYMVECLDKYFPGWSWESTSPIQFLGGEWVVAQGTLSIIDERLLAFGINPPYRKYYGAYAARITYKQGALHTPDNIIDIGNNVKSANSEAMKVAINRLTHIGDDIYGKRIEEEGAGSVEEAMIFAVKQGGGSSEFGRWVQENKWKWSDIFKILNIKDLSEVINWEKAMNDVKEAKGIK